MVCCWVVAVVEVTTIRINTHLKTKRHPMMKFTITEHHHQKKQKQNQKQSENHHQKKQKQSENHHQQKQKQKQKQKQTTYNGYKKNWRLV